MSGLFKSKSSSSQNTHTETTTTPFRNADGLMMLDNYNNYLGQAQNNYYNTMAGINNRIGSVDSVYSDSVRRYKDYLTQLDSENRKYDETKRNADYSKFLEGWNDYNSTPLTNMKIMANQSLNPYDDEVTRNYVDASNAAAYLNNGSAVNQMYQNYIGSNMGNSASHQTAMAKVGAQLAANINAQNQDTYMKRQNQLESNAQAATKYLSDYYNTKTGRGLEYAGLTQKDLEREQERTLKNQDYKLNALNQYSNLYGNYANSIANLYGVQNNALSGYGYAIGMGANPMTVSNGSSSTTNTSSPSFASALLGLGSLYYGFK